MKKTMAKKNVVFPASAGVFLRLGATLRLMTGLPRLGGGVSATA